LAIVIEFYRRICVRRDGDGANDNDIEITTAPSSREINDACRIFSRPCPMKYLILAGFSGIASMAIGIAKEMGDEYNIWHATLSIRMALWLDANQAGVIFLPILLEFS